MSYQRTLNIGTYIYEPIYARFTELIEKKNLKIFKFSSYNCEAISTDAIEDSVLYAEIGDKNPNLYFLFDNKNVVSVIRLSGGIIEIRTAGSTVDAISDELTRLKTIAPVAPPPKDDSIYVTFWSMTKDGPTSNRRTLDDIPNWHDIYFNYNESTRNEINPIMDPEFRPKKRGQLILWHGEPGTGKTTALRALGKEWKKWCEVHYITDPENFLTVPDYMMNVLIGNQDTWRIVVFEDAGEFLSADARERVSSQGLSRFLNIMDGLIGEGLNFMCLVTTNEELKKLHPAVTRSGRCMSVVEFNRLDPKEVQDWANRNDIDYQGSSHTLAELYAKKDELDITPRKEKILVGFGT